jgi:hypothetical protein
MSIALFKEAVSEAISLEENCNDFICCHNCKKIRVIKIENGKEKNLLTFIENERGLEIKEKTQEAIKFLKRVFVIFLKKVPQAKEKETAIIF